MYRSTLGLIVMRKIKNNEVALNSRLQNNKEQADEIPLPLRPKSLAPEKKSAPRPDERVASNGDARPLFLLRVRGHRLWFGQNNA